MNGSSFHFFEAVFKSIDPASLKNGSKRDGSRQRSSTRQTRRAATQPNVQTIRWVTAESREH